MEEKTEELSPPANKRQPILCEECKLYPSKYKCPGCSIRSCSLPCVNSHKKRTACTGKRPVTSFVPISQFDDNLLVSDYNMLEDVKRIAESAQRMRMKLCGNSHFKLPLPLKNLKYAATSRRTKLLFLSSGMSKRQKNKTYYNYRKKFILWTVEWRFHSTDVVLLDHGIHENTTLSSVIENHLKPGPWNHPLKQFCDEALDSLKFFIRKYPKKKNWRKGKSPEGFYLCSTGFVLALQLHIKGSCIRN
ncbi:HIT-type Zinc finger family protein [Striga hermonthica]|uniref:HIT-type Zinc finger family protein n=1 Tax=Striga hermonthica TaxID=68872 RepID=A0A9N7RA21_STRHE|nr:HIT-type Zinc finger family protein [Striga hermonthica]